ncbi:3-hydroxyisobutyrate dehydrogenase [Nitrococcus mobilis]|uniref:3-hydroxyisobutyrate dehydrogenase n=1 Tax=Nitrococcus mobilis Nb-231 TaxID=314278 RepID=A4BSH0_9GAMM|nr:3-hydroxyisobutyrate dehydrogenase [Nitrococcus mobilis]EAR21430.1 3-hydroxyisobutyrate dehydrogenase [Nitrococcus mobilis Nb-231]
MAKIAFIGLGNMGAPMAVNLLKAGHGLVAFDLVPEAMQQLADKGATPARSAAQAVAHAAVVISMLPAGKQVRDLYLGTGRVLASVSTGTLLIDCSTIAAEDARAVAAAANSRGLAFLDAPVSGGIAGAQAGTLTFIVGGEAQPLEAARPILEVMGRNVFHAGGHGAGQLGKICNNMLLGILMLGTCEALNLAVAHELNPAIISEIMRSSSGNNWVLQAYNPLPGLMENTPATRGYEGGFLSHLMAKDLALAMNAALASGTSTPLGSVASSLYAMHCANGNDRRDFSSIIQFLQGGRLD